MPWPTSSSRSRRSSRSARRRRSTRSTTCCAASATCPPTRSAPGPRAVPPSPIRGWTELAAARRAVRVRIAGDERWIAIEDVARYRDGVGVTAAARRARGVPGPGRRRARGPARALRPDARPVPDPRAGSPLGPAGRDRRRRPGAAARERLAAASASSARAAPSASGATPTSCGSCAADRWPGSGARSSRSIRTRSAASCRRGTAWRRSAARARTRRRSAARPRSSAWPRSSTSWPASPIPASVLERDVLPARVPGYQPRLLDELGAMGEVGWVGRGSLGRDDGRIALFRPGRDALRPTGPADGMERPDERAARPRSASTSPGAGPASTARSTPRPGAARTASMLDALWDLVWAGEVTNDTFAPLRALRWKRPTGGNGTRRPRARAPHLARAARGRRPLVAGRAGRRDLTATERLHAQALALLERHGVLTREAVAGEGVEGGFAGVYPVLRALEEAGRIRRGYFVDGLGAAQFALAGRPRSTARRARARRPASRRRRPPPGRRRSRQPLRRRPAVAPPRRDRPAAVPASGGGLRRARGRRRGALPGTRRRHAPDARPRPTTRRSPRSRCGRWRTLVERPAAPASSSSARSMACPSGVAVPRPAPRAGFSRRLSRPDHPRAR